MAEGFRKDAVRYLLVLRLAPTFPFWAVNLAPALPGMRFLPFLAATGLGVTPATIVYSTFGAGLGQIFDAGAQASVQDVFNSTMIAALIGLGCLALLPLALKRMRAHRSTRR